MLLKRWLLQWEESIFFRRGEAERLVPGEALEGCWLQFGSLSVLCQEAWAGTAFLSVHAFLSVFTPFTVTTGYFGSWVPNLQNLRPSKVLAVIPRSFCCCTEQRSTDKLPEFAVQQFICNTEREKGLDTIQSLTFSLVSGVAWKISPFFHSRKRQKWLVLLWPCSFF